MSETTTTPAEPAPGPVTLAIDIGGTGLKAARLDSEGALIGAPLRIATPHPSPPSVVVPALSGMANSLGRFDRVSVGFPGAVRAGQTLTAPNLGNQDWKGFDLAKALSELLGAPVRVENDATVQGLGVISGTGLELVITLGTGFGFALYEDGRIAPHLEMSQHIARGRKTYDQYLGVAALRKVGRKRWNRRVERALAQLRAVVIFDRLYIGGGDASKLDIKLPDDIKIVSNQAGLTGGARLWNEANSP
jgi:polyphosphate glucokinase